MEEQKIESQLELCFMSKLELELLWCLQPTSDCIGAALDGNSEIRTDLVSPMLFLQSKESREEYINIFTAPFSQLYSDFWCYLDKQTFFYSVYDIHIPHFKAWRFMLYFFCAVIALPLCRNFIRKSMIWNRHLCFLEQWPSCCSGKELCLWTLEFVEMMFWI